MTEERYWAVVSADRYSIISLQWDQFPAGHYNCVSGPFVNLERAKRQVRVWVSCYRKALSAQLTKINALKADEVKDG